jgi:hypothetical protein
MPQQIDDQVARRTSLAYRPIDLNALYAALDAQRRSREMSWLGQLAASFTRASDLKRLRRAVDAGSKVLMMSHRLTINE